MAISVSVSMAERVTDRNPELTIAALIADDIIRLYGLICTAFASMFFHAPRTKITHEILHTGARRRGNTVTSATGV